MPAPDLAGPCSPLLRRLASFFGRHNSQKSKTPFHHGVLKFNVQHVSLQSAFMPSVVLPLGV